MRKVLIVGAAMESIHEEARIALRHLSVATCHPIGASPKMDTCQEPEIGININRCGALGSIIGLALAFDALANTPMPEVERLKLPVETYSKKRRKGLTDKSNLRHKYHK